MAHTGKRWKETQARSFENICKRGLDSGSFSFTKLHNLLDISRQTAYHYKKSRPKLSYILQFHKNELISKIEQMIATSNPREVNVRGLETMLRQLSREYRQSYQDLEVVNTQTKETAPVVIDLGSSSDIKLGGIDGQ